MSDSMDRTAALERFYKIITKLSRKTPAAHRGWANKVGYSSPAVAGYHRAMDPLVRVLNYELKVQKLYGELEAQFQLKREA